MLEASDIPSTAAEPAAASPELSQVLALLAVLVPITLAATAAAVYVARRRRPAWDVARTPRVAGPRGWRAMGVAALGVLWLWVAIGVAAGAMGLAGNGAALSLVGVAIGVGGTLLGVALLRLFGRGEVRLGLSRPRGVMEGLAWLGVVLPWVWTTALSVTAVRLALGHDVVEVHPLIEQMLATNDASLIVLLVVQAAIAAPLAEEFFFRGLVQTAIVAGCRRFASPTPAVALGVTLTSLGFALVHPMWSWPTIFVLSLAFGAAYERSGNLWVPIGMHLGFNAIVTTIALAQA